MRNYIEDVPQPHSLPLPNEMSQHALLEMLNISDATVRLNREGKLTRDQQDFVREQIRTDQDGVRLLATIFVSTLLLLSLIFIIEALSMSYLILGGGAFLVGFAAYIYSRQQKRTRDLSVNVGKATGDLRLVNSSTLGQWGLLIDDKFFPISEGLAQKFDGYRHPFVAAYYTLGTNTLLSMEVLDDEKRKNDDIDYDGEASLDAWDKPKNTLAVEDPAEAPVEDTSENQRSEQEQAPRSKRRF